MHLPDPKQALRNWTDPNSALWTPWKSAWLDEPNSLKQIPLKTGGAYVLGIGVSSFKSVTLRRLLGGDPHGVLDIGESRTLRGRLQTLRRCIYSDGVTGHMAGWRFRAMHLHERLKGRLYVSWLTGTESYAMEASMLSTYLAAFGELPPLNYKYNWSRVRQDQ